MAKTATLTLLLSVVGDGVNEQSVPIASWQNTSSPGIRGQLVTLAAGDNTLDPPQSPQATALVGILLAPTGFTLKLKGIGSDTGYQLGSATNVLLFDVGSANGSDGKAGSFVVNANGQCVATIYWL